MNENHNPSTFKSFPSEHATNNKPFGRVLLDDKKRKYKRKKKDLTQEQIEVFKQAFEIFDSNKSGSIDEEELKALMNALGYEGSPQIVKQILEEIDVDGSGVIEVNEFIEFMSKHMLDTDNLKRQMTKVFAYFDDDRSGYLDAKKLKKMASQCFFNLEDDMIEQMIQIGDTQGNGKISKYQFLRVMKKVKLL